MDKEIVYFELNNWSCGKDYPAAEPFLSWMGNDYKLAFLNESFVRENKLCVVKDIIDMSVNFCITATKQWVMDNCPELLTKYTDFLRYPDEYGDVIGRFDNEFLEYDEENIGIQDVYIDDEEDDEDEID